MAEIGRLLTAMVTPFDEEGEIDYTKARKLARALLDSGSDGLVIGGTTGESPSMSDDEKIRLFAEVKEEIGDEGAVIAGTTDNNHRKSVELSIEAEKVGVRTACFSRFPPTTSRPRRACTSTSRRLPRPPHCPESCTTSHPGRR